MARRARIPANVAHGRISQMGIGTGRLTGAWIALLMSCLLRFDCWPWHAAGDRKTRMSRAQGEECNLGADTISVNAAVARQIDAGVCKAVAVPWRFALWRTDGFC